MSRCASKLARYQTYKCQQIMPVPVFPICSISKVPPRAISEMNPPLFPMPADNTPKVVPLKILSYPPNETPPPGTILSNTTGSTPTGYLLCNGMEVSRSTYHDLFEVIGTYYGEGDNSTTFNVPNLSLHDGPHDETNPNVSYIIKI